MMTMNHLHLTRESLAVCVNLHALPLKHSHTVVHRQQRTIQVTSHLWISVIWLSIMRGLRIMTWHRFFHLLLHISAPPRKHICTMIQPHCYLQPVLHLYSGRLQDLVSARYLWEGSAVEKADSRCQNFSLALVRRLCCVMCTSLIISRRTPRCASIKSAASLLARSTRRLSNTSWQSAMNQFRWSPGWTRHPQPQCEDIFYIWKHRKCMVYTSFMFITDTVHFIVHSPNYLFIIIMALFTVLPIDEIIKYSNQFISI